MKKLLKWLSSLYVGFIVAVLVGYAVAISILMARLVTEGLPW